jgi:hypothetical protein
MTESEIQNPVTEAVLNGFGIVTALSRATGYGGDEHDLVAILEGVGFAAEEADVFVVNVDVDEAAKLAVFAFDLGGESRECLVDIGQKACEILGGGVEVFAAIGVAGEGSG